MLLVVDVQVGVMAASWDAARVAGQVARAVERARARGVPVIWVQHEADDLQRGSAAWQLVPELVPAAGETRIDKRYPSSFEQTELERELARVGAAHIVLAGAQTNWCIRATAYAALERGYDLTLLEDAHTTASIDAGGAGCVPASGIVADLNLTLKWLEYPGRRSATASAGGVDFGV
ncbi:MAG: isochorismatase family protein [Burkholderiales bacterium]|nr:isochorismatase family protein [Burkholderiales bacterium]MDE1927193.1 isochorismatase family protein [Burkholderiales bacterium]MDE2504476.1 isochorismatase family protein [Burkholderiales bacterium]